MKSFNANDLRLLNAWLDPELEAALGYRLFSNPQAAATPYTRQTRCEVHSNCRPLQGGQWSLARWAASWVRSSVLWPYHYLRRAGSPLGA
mmetsp:Transcript_49857/g.131185  ORF Transcript_49857/g.131185 Transcript_49857/m.131185 type:complete len:90 (+) Transcript_49857:424-693(+)